jgi:hypothetical protein
MFTAILLACNLQGTCRALANPVLYLSEKVCEQQVQVGTNYLMDNGWIVYDWKCIEWSGNA